MKLIIELKMDNAAFADNPQGEPARILDRLAMAIHGCEFSIEPDSTCKLRDINGNRVGEARVEP